MKLIDYQIGEYNPEVEAYAVQVLQGDGIYDVRKCGLGTLIFKVNNSAFVSLPTTLKAGVQLAVPKIPSKVFTDLLAFYRHIYSLYHSEVYVAVFYDPIGKKWFYFVPKQTVSGALAKISESAGQELNDLREKFILVLESHSHHTMGGRFSGIDDADQTVPDVIHLVIGNIDRESPSYEIRIALGKNKVNLNYIDIFESEDYILDLGKFPEWKERVMQPKVPMNITWGKHGNNIIDADTQRTQWLENRAKVDEQIALFNNNGPFDQDMEDWNASFDQQPETTSTGFYSKKITKEYIRA